MLRLENVSVAYGKHEALHDVTLDVEAGRTTVILGANGAGKTTLFKTIAGLVRPRARRAHPVRGPADRGRVAAPDRRCRHRAGARGTPPVRRHDRHRQPAHGRLHRHARADEAAAARKAARAVPAPRRTPGPAGQDHERRRAADAGDRPRADVGAEDAAARRAVARPGAAPGQGPVRDLAQHHAARAVGGAGGAERAPEPAVGAIASMCWRTATSCVRDRPAKSRKMRRSSRPISGCRTSGPSCRPLPRSAPSGRNC